MGIRRFVVSFARGDCEAFLQLIGEPGGTGRCAGIRLTRCNNAPQGGHCYKVFIVQAYGSSASTAAAISLCTTLVG